MMYTSTWVRIITYTSRRGTHCYVSVIEGTEIDMGIIKGFITSHASANVCALQYQ